MRRFVFTGLALLLAGRRAHASLRAGHGHHRHIRDGSGGVLPGVTVEASSPALIEKTRTVVSDARGEYRIVDLRPGAYIVTFTLPGFSTVRREGIELTNGFTASVDADLRVGALEETITVSGQAPVVDTSSVAARRTITKDTIDALPTGKNWNGIGQLTVGHREQPGRRGRVVRRTAEPGVDPRRVLHGQHPHDGRHDAEQLRLQLLVHGAFVERLVHAGADLRHRRDFGRGGRRRRPDQHHRQGWRQPVQRKRVRQLRHEFLAGRQPGRPISSRAGSRRWTHSTSSTTRAWASAGRSCRIASGSGPSQKYWGTNLLRANDYWAVDPFANIYTPDLSRQAIDDQWNESLDLRLTWQMSAKNKISAYGNWAPRETPHWTTTSLRPPEAANRQRIMLNHFETLVFRSTISNKLLFEAGAGNMTEDWTREPIPDGPSSLGYAITELSTGVNYRAYSATFSHNVTRVSSFRSALSYVTGSHSFKFGWQMQNGTNRVPAWHGPMEYPAGQLGDLALNFRTGSPSSVTVYTTPYTELENMDADLGLYAQDQWTHGPAHGQPRRALRLDEGEHPRAGRAGHDLGRRPALRCHRQPAELEGHRPARRRVVRPLRQRPYRAQGDHQPVRHDQHHRVREGEQPALHVDQQHDAPVDRQKRGLPPADR